MNARATALAGAVFACGAVMAHAAGRNPRDSKNDVEYTVAARVTDPELMGEWLFRLAGRYRVEGQIPRGEESLSVAGAVDCRSVGGGPGLQCIFNVLWPEIWNVRAFGASAAADGSPWMNPAMMLMGLDMQEQSVRFMLVDSKGLPQVGTGIIAGERSTLQAKCPNPRAIFEQIIGLVNGRPPTTCHRVFRLELPPGERITYMVIELVVNDLPIGEINMSLYRTAADDPTPMKRKRRK